MPVFVLLRVTSWIVLSQERESDPRSNTKLHEENQPHESHRQRRGFALQLRKPDKTRMEAICNMNARPSVSSSCPFVFLRGSTWLRHGIRSTKRHEDTRIELLPLHVLR